MKKILLLLSLATTSKLCLGQENPNPVTFFGKAKNVREMAVLRLHAIPDSADFFQIFNEPFATKAWQFSRFNHCYAYKNLVMDTTNEQSERVKLPDIHYETYTIQQQFANLLPKLDSSAFFFKTPALIIYDVSLGKDPHAEYYAREWAYVNNRWICLYDLRPLLMAINEDKLHGMENFRCPVKE